VAVHLLLHLNGFAIFIASRVRSAFHGPIEAWQQFCGAATIMMHLRVVLASILILAINAPAYSDQAKSAMLAVFTPSRRLNTMLLMKHTRKRMH